MDKTWGRDSSVRYMVLLHFAGSPARLRIMSTLNQAHQYQYYSITGGVVVFVNNCYWLCLSIILFVVLTTAGLSEELYIKYTLDTRKVSMYITSKQDQTCTARHLRFKMIGAYVKIVNTNYYKLTWYWLFF